MNAPPVIVLTSGPGTDMAAVLRELQAMGFAINTAVQPHGPVVTLRAAVADTLAAKTAAGLRPKYLVSLRHYLTAFIRDREDLPVGDVGVADLESWFTSRHESPAARASNVGRLSALFGYAVRRDWIQDNPCKRLERLRQTEKTPAILTPEQAEQLLRETRKRKPPALRISS